MTRQPSYPASYCSRLSAQKQRETNVKTPSDTRWGGRRINSTYGYPY